MMARDVGRERQYITIPRDADYFHLAAKACAQSFGDAA
jgi:hypothetical protein